MSENTETAAAETSVEVESLAKPISTLLIASRPRYADPGLVAVVAAYVGNHTVPVADLGNLISTVKTGLGLEEPVVEEPPAEEPVRKLTAKEIKAAVQPDSILCFEDGKRYKTMRRVLSAHGLSPEAYRTKWGLPDDHPITAPNYAAQRREIAISKGFGRRKGSVTEQAAA